MSLTQKYSIHRWRGWQFMLGCWFVTMAASCGGLGSGADGGAEGRCRPTAEICDGIDNDCDGYIDNTVRRSPQPLTRPCSSACGSGTEHCDAGRWVACDAPQPRAEVCDGRDNNCNGQVDENLGTSTCGIGACQRTVDNCSAGSTKACVPGTPTSEICDGRDNDCDGSVDEGLADVSCGLGACRRTISSCVNGAPQACMPGSPSAERCDGLDNDCDGLVDEELPALTCGIGACRRTVAACINGAPQTCTPGSPTTERCDRIDNDCDSLVDEGFGTISCGIGACRRTVSSCVNGVPQLCTPGTPTAEVCDSIDNDCDGLADENYACPSRFQVVAARARFTPQIKSLSVPLARPAGATSCIPLVAWEKVIEHSDDQCDFHARYDGARGAFDVWVEHCGLGWNGSSEVAVARVALLCAAGGGAVAYRAVSADASASASFAFLPTNTSQVIVGASMSTMDGQGDVDMEAISSVLYQNGVVQGSVRQNCGGGGAYAEAQIYALGLPSDVVGEYLPFNANNDNNPVYVEHRYAANGPPDHVAFVLPAVWDTDCNDHGSFESKCWDTGSRIVCSLRAYGSVDKITGNVLFLDGRFPNAGEKP